MVACSGTHSAKAQVWFIFGNSVAWEHCLSDTIVGGVCRFGNKVAASESCWIQFQKSLGEACRLRAVLALG